MKSYIITFPQSDRQRTDGWVRVKAFDVFDVKDFADKTYGENYSSIYGEEQFTNGYYPKGCLDEITLS